MVSTQYTLPESARNLRLNSCSLLVPRTMTIIHAENVLLENIYVNSTDLEHPVDFDFSSLNVRISRFNFQMWSGVRS